MKVSFHVLRMMGVWVAFIAIHGACMAIDWQLRDPLSPMLGGFPSSILTPMQWGSIVFLFAGTIFFLPRTWALWARILISLLSAAVGFVLMIFGWVFYIVGNGIDSI